MLKLCNIHIITFVQEESKTELKFIVEGIRKYITQRFIALYIRRIRKLWKKAIAMRTKYFLVVVFCALATTLLFIILGPPGEPNDSLKSIVSQTHQQLNKLQKNLRVSNQKKLDIDPKYLTILGFTQNLHATTLSRLESSYYNYQANNADDGKNPHPIELKLMQQEKQKHQESQTDINFDNEQLKSVSISSFNGTKTNFSIVTYVQDDQLPLVIHMLQNIANKLPNEFLMIYDIGLAEKDSKLLNAYCNNSKCAIISYDLTIFPSYISDKRMHAYRPIIIKDALTRSKCILFAENYMRIRGTKANVQYLRNKVSQTGVLGWNTPTAVSTRTHPRMFDYFQTDADDFLFLRMVDLDTVLFVDNIFVTENILLPWIKCILTLECLDPIGAQSNGCKYNKKPQYRYSGCHGYDTSAFNIVMGLTMHLDHKKYSLPSDTYNIFYKETLEQATKVFESRRRNSTESSDHPFTED